MSWKQNLRALRFHINHGKHILLEQNATKARRIDGYHHGITFTNRPVMIDEPILLQINKTATNWSGALRIGFTVNDPKKMKNKIPAHSCPDLINLEGNWAKALPEKVINNEDYLLSFHVDIKGDIYYGINDEEKQFLLSGVATSTALWGIIDVYGNTVEIELLGSDLEYIGEQISDSTLAFHQMHGRTATLNKNKTVAFRNHNVTYYSYVFSDRPFKFGEKMIIQIVKIDHLVTGPLMYGVTSCDPLFLSPEMLPSDPYDLLDWPDYWIIQSDTDNYEANDILIFSIDTEGKLMMTRNSTSVGAVFHVDISKPLWLFFKLSGSVSTICAKGSSTGDYAYIMREYEQLTSSSKNTEYNTHKRGSSEEICAKGSSSDDYDSMMRKFEQLTSSSKNTEYDTHKRGSFEEMCAKGSSSNNYDSMMREFEQLTSSSKSTEYNTHKTCSSKDSDSKQCLICYDKEVNCALYRCGHMCMCYECAQKLWYPGANVQCPICRDTIKDIIKTYV